MDQKARQREYSKTHYRRHKDRVRAKTVARKKAILLWLREYKAALHCKLCGYNEHPAAFDFHHRDPKMKECEIADAPNRGWNRARILREIEKCDILCANCHRIEHFGHLYRL